MAGPVVKPIVQVLGPTASGKSRTSLEIARRFDGEIISADSIQVYRGFDIGTAKVGEADRRQVPHHLIDVVSDGAQFNASRFLELAWAACGAIEARGRLVVVCGGTALYLRVMMRGLFPHSGTDPEVRSRISARADQEGLDALWRELQRIDPAYAARIGPRDRVRITRALEITRHTGRPPSEAFRDTQSPFAGRRFVRIGLQVERSELYRRIDRRVQQMVDQGLLDETERLLAQLPETSPPFRSLGYKEALQHLRGELSREEMIERIQRHTRQFAKRQLSWFRHEPDVVWFDPDRPASLIAFLENELWNAR